MRKPIQVHFESTPNMFLAYRDPEHKYGYGVTKHLAMKDLLIREIEDDEWREYYLIKGDT